jgi:flagellar assembly factor FliW
MDVKTKPYGLISVDERQKIVFPSGILGFESFREYVLLDARQPPFYWLQSLDVVEVSFVLIDPKIFRPDYTLDLPEGELTEIEIDNPDDLLTFAIVNIPEKQSGMTANLQGPVVINKQKRLGRQCISLNAAWKVKHFVLEELASVRNEAC